VIFNDGADADREKWQGLAKTYIRWAEQLACWAADVVIADSTVIQERYREQLGRDTIFIPYGANPYPRERERGRTDVLERLGLKPDGYVLFVSRLTPENKAHVLVEAFRRARTGLKLVLVGDAPYAKKYKRFLDSLCGPDVIRTGYLFGR
jgi:glycosyltransferase involved in cell wall biosynthesis